jgi:glycosyltransferase involved in cell wall biosynthesis
MAEKYPQVSVFIPAHNEGGNVVPLMEKIDRAFTVRGVRGEVVLVNDGSTDSTQEEAEACAAKYPYLTVIRHRTRRGLTAAMKTAFRQVRGDVVIFLPGDLESDPEEDIPKLLDTIDQGYDVVAGWRQGRHDNKVFASGIYNFVSRLLFGVQAHDMNWIKAFRREVVADLPLRSDWHRFVLMIAADKGYKIGEVRTNYYPRQSGNSKYGLSRIPKSFLDVLVVKFLLTFSEKPMFFFGGLGGALVGSGVLIALGLTVIYLLDYGQRRPVFDLAANMVLAGLLLFLVGFVAELVVSQQERLDDIEQDLRQRRE